jgi:hypothetical protein
MVRKSNTGRRKRKKATKKIVEEVKLSQPHAVVVHQSRQDKRHPLHIFPDVVVVRILQFTEDMETCIVTMKQIYTDCHRNLILLKAITQIIGRCVSEHSVITERYLDAMHGMLEGTVDGLIQHEKYDPLCLEALSKAEGVVEKIFELWPQEKAGWMSVLEQYPLIQFLADNGIQFTDTEIINSHVFRRRKRE